MTLTALILAAALSLPISLPTSSERLGPVDMSVKQVTVNVKVDGDYATRGLEENMLEIMDKLQEFYAQYGIEVEPRYINHLPVGHDVIDLLVVPQSKYPDPTTGGFARYELRAVYLQAFRSDRHDVSIAHDEIIADWWQTVAHEAGHLIGLNHSDMRLDDEIPDVIDGVWNLMRSVPPKREEFWRVTLVPLQVKQMHSYLSKGVVYELLEDIKNERPANGVIREYDQRMRDSTR
jgi:hypothetical protein